ncbi:MAG: HAD family hydrolase, partial [Candidatus Heimdallarchaeota archaeon]
NKLKAFNGIPRLINYCHKFDITVAVASSGTLDKIKFSLTETGLLNYFNIITSSNEIKKGKPDPELFLLSAEKMNLDPKNCLVIEDSISGIVAGNLAQMFTVGVTNTFSKDELQKSTPNLIVNNVSELL